MIQVRFYAALVALGAVVVGPSMGADDDGTAAFKKQMRNLSQETQKGSFYNAQVPVKLDDFRAAMFAVGNLGRRDPDYRKNHGEKNMATDLSGATVFFPKELIHGTEDQTHKIYKNSQTPPYFKDIVLNDALNKAAQFQAEYNASRDMGPGHDGPHTLDGDSMKYSWDRTKHFGYEGSGGEIAGAGTDPDSYPESWMGSNSHFMGWFNIGVDLREMGLGVARAAGGNWYFVGVGGRNEAPASNARQQARVQIPGHVSSKMKPVAVIKAVDLTKSSLTLVKTGSAEHKFTLAKDAKVRTTDGKPAKPGTLAAGMSVLKYSLGPKDKTVVTEITVQQQGPAPKTDPKKDPTPKTDPKKEPKLAPANAAAYSKHMKAGNTAVQQKKYTDAVKEFEAALQTMPGDKAALVALKNARAQAAALKKPKGTPEQTTGGYNKHMTDGKGAMQAKKYAAAVKEFEAALGIKPGDKEATALLKQAKAQLKK